MEDDGQAMATRRSSMYLPIGEMSWKQDEVSRAPARLADPDTAPRMPDVPAPSLPTVRLYGVRFHAVTERQTIDFILSELDAGRGGSVVTPNLDHLRRSQKDVSFAALVSEASLVVADGMPVVWASRVQGTPLPQRVAGSDLISSLSAAAAERGRSVFMLGGTPGTADAAAKVLQGRSPNLKIAGTYCPPLGFESDEDEMTRLIEILRSTSPDIIYVALGSPKQEYLIDQIARTLPRAWWLGVGISFSFLCGDVKRAPRWVQKIGMEWLHRVIQEPRRLFHRYFVVGLPFFTRLMSNALYERVMRSLGLRKTLTASGLSEIEPPVPTAPPKVERAETVTDEGTRHDTPAVSIRPDGAPSESNLRRIRGLVLLGGSVRSTELTSAIGRSLLDLPLDESGTILNHWLGHAQDLARYAGLARLPVRVTMDRGSIEPVSASPRFAGDWVVERDMSEYRGTGGILRDLAEQYADDDYLLVANAAQVLLDPLPALAVALDRRRCDVSLVAHRDGTPSGLMLVRCGALRLIKPIGFIDMKEQALPEIAAVHDVRAVPTRRPTGLPIRSLDDYLNALRLLHGKRNEPTPFDDALAENWQKRFAIVESGASVGDRAYVHDSVVLKGARVEDGAAVVRSLVCPGATVRSGQQIVDGLCRPNNSR